MKQQQLALVLLALVLTPVVGTAAEAENRPNILLIVVDRIGRRDASQPILSTTSVIMVTGPGYPKGSW